MLRHIWEFVIAVLRQWAAFVTGGVIIAGIGVYERISGKPVSGWLYWAGVIVSLVAAVFSAWRKERLTVEALTLQLHDTQRRKEVRDHLSRLLKAKDKFVKMLNDPNQTVALGNIDQWEIETCK